MYQTMNVIPTWYLYTRIVDRTCVDKVCSHRLSFRTCERMSPIDLGPDYIESDWTRLA